MNDANEGKWVEIEFDCLPLRSVGRLDVPVDASPRYAEFILRVKRAIETHGTMNAYYLHRAHCAFHVTNDRNFGEVRFVFEGTVLTDPSDRRVRGTDLHVQLQRETCDWLTEPIVQWLQLSVPRAVTVEFARYVEAGDLTKTEARLRKIQGEIEQSGGYLGMYL
jgi:hypothetical protein